MELQGRQVRQNRTTYVIISIAVLTMILLCGGLLAFGYFIFSDVGLDLPPTSTPTP